MSGFKLKCLDQDADRISVQSTSAATWVPERRKFRFLPPREYEVGVAPHEVVILKSRERNRIVLTTVDDKLVIRSTRRGTVLLVPGRATDVQLIKDETLIIQRVDIQHPTRGHRIDASVTP